MSIAYLTPDLPRNMTVGDARKLWQRESFRVGDRTFVKTSKEDATYSDGKIKCFHDPQNSTSWYARAGQATVGPFWAPEYAVEKMLKAAAAVTG